MPYITPKYGLEVPSPSTRFNELGLELQQMGISIEAVLDSFDYNGADPNLVLSRVAALEAWRTTAEAELAALTDDTDWVDITISSGFTAQSHEERPQVRRIGNKVYCKGGWNNSGIATGATSVVGTVPSGFRPLLTHFHRAGTSIGNADASILFQAGGSIQLRTSSTASAYYFITGAEWLLD